MHAFSPSECIARVVRMRPPWWLLWSVATAATMAATAADPVVGTTFLPAKPRYKGHSSERRYGRTYGNIISGTYVKEKKFPYQVYVRVFLQNGTVDFCGGAIIGVRHILTAAHCIRKPNVVQVLAVIGSEHRFDRKALNYSIAHQTFYPKEPGEQVDADIVVLMVDRPMPLGKENVKFLTLQTNRNFNRKTFCSVAGWGDSRDNLDPNLLKYVKVPIVSRSKCRHSYPRDPPNDLLCAGFYEKGGADTCQGDSGGPLVCGGRLTGIVKGGVGCGLPHFPGTYTDVSYYWRWILKVMIQDCWKVFKTRKAKNGTSRNKSSQFTRNRRFMCSTTALLQTQALVNRNLDIIK